MDAAATTEERLTPLGNAPAFAGGVAERRKTLLGGRCSVHQQLGRYQRR